jgi:hypothetical protein
MKEPPSRGYLAVDKLSSRFIMITADADTQDLEAGEVGMVYRDTPSYAAAFPRRSVPREAIKVRSLSAVQYRMLDTSNPLDAAEIAAFLIMHDHVQRWAERALRGL